MNDIWYKNMHIDDQNKQISYIMFENFVLTDENGRRVLLLKTHKVSLKFKLCEVNRNSMCEVKQNSQNCKPTNSKKGS